MALEMQSSGSMTRDETFRMSSFHRKHLYRQMALTQKQRNKTSFMFSKYLHRFQRLSFNKMQTFAGIAQQKPTFHIGVWKKG